MWPLAMSFLRRYTPYITLPFAGVIGFLGYHIEGMISNRYTPSTAPILQQRQERFLEDMDTSANKRKHSPLEVNLSPSLSS